MSPLRQKSRWMVPTTRQVPRGGFLRALTYADAAGKIAGICELKMPGTH